MIALHKQLYFFILSGEWEFLSLLFSLFIQRVAEGSRAEQRKIKAKAKAKAMGVISNKIERENLKRGDHIYSWRLAYAYSHHGALSISSSFTFSIIFIFIFVFGVDLYLTSYSCICFTPS